MSNKPVRPTEDQVHLSWKKKKRRAGQERAHIFRASSASVDMTSTASNETANRKKRKKDEIELKETHQKEGHISLIGDVSNGSAG
ncbi:hypothetical protein OUZ56_004638 [Daphnia magna]|uniref:Uncharacterized protein n=1 Tax=Daphnia magna TaxID=35525 RepID=A0ABQ9YQD8_9CRUS|nr:hypothetical protein OUZ56_004638 [Daphnia magna]